MQDKQENPYSFVKQTAEIGVTTLISAYFFTAGYINSFSLPIRVDFFQSGYFLIVLLADSVPAFLFDFFTGILKLPIYIFLFFTNAVSNFNILYKAILQPFIENWIFLIVVSISVLIIATIFYIKLKYQVFFKKLLNPFIFLWRKTKLISPHFRFFIFYIIYMTFIKTILKFKDLKLFTSIFGSIQKKLGACRHFSGIEEEKNPCIKVSNFLYDLEFYINNIGNVIFILTLLFVTFSIPIFIKLYFNGNYNFKFKSKEFLSLLLVILLSISSSYYLGRVYLEKFIDYPVYRADITKTEQRVQIWRDKNDYFYVECKETSGSSIKGVNTQTEEVFYTRYLDKSTHPKLCPQSKKKKKTTFKDKVKYTNCHYKNSKDEVLAADFCVGLSNYIVVRPRGSLLQCYIHSSQIVEFFEDKTKPPYLYRVTDKDMKRYKDNYKHTPITKRKNPLSSPGFSITQYTKRYGPSIPEGSHKILFIYSFENFATTFEIVEFTKAKKPFGYKIEIVSHMPFKDIKTHFPKCD